MTAPNWLSLLCLIALSAQAAGAPNDAVPPMARPASAEGRLVSYEERRISFGTVTLVGAQTGAIKGRWEIPYQGGHPLEGVSFYRALGRDDLVRSYEAKDRFRWMLGLAGGAAVVAGLAVTAAFLPNARCVVFDRAAGKCVATQGFDVGPLSLSVALAGAVAIAVALFTNPNPLDTEAAHSVVDEYNKRLRDDLGLSSSRRAPTSLERVASSLRLDLRVDPRGEASIGARVSF